MRVFVIVVLGVVLAAGCASTPPQARLPKPPSRAFDPSVETALKQTFEPAARAHDGKSGFRLVSRGIDGLTARVELIDASQHTLDVQSYIFRADESGNLIALALLRAADRGVRVRVLVDDGDTLAGDEKILSLSANPGIEVRIFNPLSYRGHNEMRRAAEVLFHKGRLDYRMHNKMMVADNAAAIIGGRNIGNQYFQIDPASQFCDDDVVAAGPVVQRLSAVFDEFWNGDMAVPAPAIDRPDTSERAFSAYLAALARYRDDLDAKHGAAAPAPPHAPLADIISGRAPLIWAPVQLTFDSPDKKEVVKGAAPGRLIATAVLERAKRVDSEFLIFTPYFVPSPDELAALASERDRHARVRVLTNSLESTPSLAAQSGYMRFRVQLLHLGVELHEVRALLGNTTGSGEATAISRYGNYGLHAKLYVFDRKSLFVGSMNYDQRSKHLNTEIGLIIDSPQLSQEIAARFDELTRLENAYALSDAPAGAGHLVWTSEAAGTVVHRRIEPARSGWQRLKVKFLSMLPLDREL
ncbi:MAG: phospholipase D-like domain-containing protein [Steroidobacteraceae bacterium]|jgi:putative cardiolipin synthase